jgi:hypothetical protein
MNLVPEPLKRHEERASVLDCGGKRSATPLSNCVELFIFQAATKIKSGVTATALQDGKRDS